MSKKIKVLLTIPNFNTAGSGKVLYDLAKGLDKNCFEVSIACKNNKGAFFRKVESLALPIYFIDPTVPIRPYYLLVKRIGVFKKFVKDHKFDIVHSWHWSSDWTEVLATRWAGAKFVYTKKAMTWGNVHWKIKSYLSNYIITLNEEMKNYFPHKKNQRLIPLGINTNYYRKDENSTDSKEHFFKVITVANLVPVKNIEVLIKAIHLLNNRNIQLDILGDHTTVYGNVLIKMAHDLNLEKQITFLGKHHDVRPFLAEADLYIISSYMEGMPMALVEAMSMGLPVLGSDIPGVNFVLKDFQMLVFDASSAQLLSKKIDDFYHKSKEERNKLGQKLRAYSIARFSLEKFINAHEELYSKLTEE